MDDLDRALVRLFSEEPRHRRPRGVPAAEGRPGDGAVPPRQARGDRRDRRLVAHPRPGGARLPGHRLPHPRDPAGRGPRPRGRPARRHARGARGLHTITGVGDMWCRVVARSNADLQRVIDAVLSCDGVVRSTAVIALAHPDPPPRAAPARRRLGVGQTPGITVQDFREGVASCKPAVLRGEGSRPPCAGAGQAEGEEMTAELVVEVVDADADDERLSDLTQNLRGDLLELDVESVRRLPQGDAPPGTRALELAAIGTLVVVLKGSVELAEQVVSTVRAWLRRAPEGERTSPWLQADPQRADPRALRCERGAAAAGGGPVPAVRARGHAGPVLAAPPGRRARGPADVEPLRLATVGRRDPERAVPQEGHRLPVR